MLAERLDAVDVRRLEDPALPRRVGGHRAADLVDDLGRHVDVGAVGDGHVLVDARPDPGQVGGDLDLAVGHRVDDPVEVAQRRPAEREVLDRAGDAGDADDVALGELVLDEDQGAVEVVADEALGAEADRDADDPEPGDGRPDVEARAGPGSSGRRSTTMKNWTTLPSSVVERVHPLGDLDGGQLLGRALGRLAVEQGLDDRRGRRAGRAAAR